MGHVVPRTTRACCFSSKMPAELSFMTIISRPHHLALSSHTNTRLSPIPYPNGLSLARRGVVLFSAALSVRPPMRADVTDCYENERASQVAIHACVVCDVFCLSFPFRDNRKWRRRRQQQHSLLKQKSSRSIAIAPSQHSYNRQSSKECERGGRAARIASGKEMVAYY